MRFDNLDRLSHFQYREARHNEAVLGDISHDREWQVRILVDGQPGNYCGPEVLMLYLKRPSERIAD